MQIDLLQVSYQLLPCVVHISDVLSLPLFQIKDVHSICPSTSMGVKIFRDMWVREIKISVKAMEGLPTGLNSTIHIALQINRPKPAKVLLDHYIIIQEQNFLQLRKYLWQIKSKMVEDRQILWVAEFQIWI